ncbi:MAG: carboxypeptidase-like regulatory domain-containing protein [Planctomycetaceae bacterium]|jgi:hypothetical protein|nr:carboxypeptidase-like regulatory domain-containing protein [Planctomycetaceae bacterium]
MRTVLFLCLFCVAACVGCGSKGFRVDGKVTLSDGKPVARGQITFTSDTFSAGGETIADGTYTIHNIPAGTYRVTVKASGESQSDPKVDVADVKPAKPVVDKKYNDPATSGLTCEVKGSTSYDITVEPPK